jgi:hypothetical protein
MKGILLLLVLGFVGVASIRDQVAEKQADIQLYYVTRRTAEMDDAEAQAKVGERYSAGLGVAKDAAEAVQWYPKAAELRADCFISRRDRNPRTSKEYFR